jgi:hypothetical protein
VFIKEWVIQFPAVCMFLSLFLLLSSSFIALWSDRMHSIISVFLYLLRLALCPWIWSILEKVPWVAEKNVYCIELDEIFCRHQVGPFDLLCILDVGFLYQFFCLNDLCIDDNWVLKSPTTTVLELINAFRSFKVCLMKLGALTLGAYRLILAISFWSIPPLLVWNVLLYLTWSM